jgi:SagB-type dehydrogenase family enzyme
VTSQIPTAQFASVVYGTGVELDDPAERFHEAAKLYPCSAGRQMSGARQLAGQIGLQRSVERPGRRFQHLPSRSLPKPRAPKMSLRRALGKRQSRPPALESTLGLAELSAVLDAANGLSERPGRRSTPSGGALYPLELYVLAKRVDDLTPGIHHFDPHSDRLERLRQVDHGALRECLVDPSIADNAAALLVLTAMFWRSRFKYGLRGYRFALLEAGHAVQNALLVGTALGLAALPLGGYYDARVDSLLGIDGVNESAVYLVALGRP